MENKSLGLIIGIIIAIFGLTFVLYKIVFPLFSTTNVNLNYIVDQFDEAIESDLLLHGCSLQIPLYNEESILLFTKTMNKIIYGDGNVIAKPSKFMNKNIICACDDVSVDIVCQNSLLCREIEYVPKPFQNTKYYDPKAKYYFSSKTELSKKHDLFPFVNMMYYLRLQDSELEIYPIFGLSSNKIQEVYDLDRCIIN
ncbi:hypothetical protein HOK68_04345 [Candidatus Woesearchaeota archaeon]|jgi:hypothetical protein|nr:hypothetical protein [Candidatus Woesearchaeota archaeon]MBT4387278.1 hypothetical protein [Candidatus Woesearchaeota archaeon]MBT4595417.1 hypothetical protein [Candidatus Woesearchaeota archaeon]MBT5741132.1 hypothetical protein [Candidatus Woesearchaeota archaeon]MBT6505981.1 hypothetical protein [Candidatus Woesearchaeota archaeon]